MSKELTEEELLQMEMEVGGTIQDLVNEHLEIEGWRSAIISGAYKCLKEHKPLHELSITIAARAIARVEMAKRNNKEQY